MEIHPKGLQRKMGEMLDILHRYGFKFKVGTGRDLRSRSHLLNSIYNVLSKKINPNSVGYFYADNINDLKIILSEGDIAPQVLFERK